MKPADRCIWISLSYATFGLIVSSGLIADAPPIARWTIGKPEQKVTTYYRTRGAIIREI